MFTPGENVVTAKVRKNQRGNDSKYNEIDWNEVSKLETYDPAMDYEG